MALRALSGLQKSSTGSQGSHGCLRGFYDASDTTKRSQRRLKESNERFTAESVRETQQISGALQKLFKGTQMSSRVLRSLRGLKSVSGILGAFQTVAGCVTGIPGVSRALHRVSGKYNGGRKKFQGSSGGT